MRAQYFGEWWATVVLAAMQKSGHGVRLNAVKHSGVGIDRRKDKLNGESKLMRSYRNRYSGA